MCIRDSSKKDAAKGRLGIVLQHGKVQLPFVAHDQRPVVAAVSYTHLRAHETVLDIVCRLLLEKKNNYAIQILLSTYDQAQTTSIHGVSDKLYRDTTITI